MRLPVPPDCIKDTDKRSKMARKGILPFPLRSFRKLAICCQLNSSSRRQFWHHHTSHRARHRFRALSLTHWGTTRSRFILLKRWQMARKQRKDKFRWQHGPNDMAGKHQKEERGKIPLLQVLGREIIGGKALRSQQAGTGVKAPGQPSLLNEGIQQTVGDGCKHADGNSKLRGTFFHRAIIGIKTEKNTSQITASEEVVVMPMRWQQGKISKLNNVENK